MTKRYVSDCRKFPSKSKCDLVMTGSFKHLVPASVDHAVLQHGHKRSPALTSQIKAMIKGGK